ncbi:MAG TPA: GGDEF domain-containing protein [Burkholderiales bacterium]|nr:GGDEF domain-containing protein [Burkholderiales bacterium]
MDSTLRTKRIGFGIGAVYALLALLSSRTGEYLAAIELFYTLPMVYGMLRLDRTRLAILAAFALVTHGTALLMLVEREHRFNQPALWLQFAMLALAFACTTYAAGAVLRRRERLAEARRDLHDLSRQASERASRDTLTGVYHHRHLMEALEREIARAERVGKPLSIARVDLDWLGSVNETHGHSIGDIALKRFTVAAAEALRDVDIFGRYGGKEFLAIMPDTDLKGAAIAAERLRAAVAREPVPEVRGRRHLSCTLGVAEHRKGENTRLVIGRAESGLNYAKAAGRDRVVALDLDGRPVIVGAA